MQMTIEPVPAVVLVEDSTTDRRVEFSFEVHNRGEEELRLVAIERDVYGPDRSLIQRRTVYETLRLGPGARRTVRNPVARSVHGIPFRALVFTFAFQSPQGELLSVQIRVPPIESTTALKGDAAPRPAHWGEAPVSSTPRRGARGWYRRPNRLGIHAAPALAGP
jgi:hypothetical protein